jgi:hypothetical protein
MYSGGFLDAARGPVWGSPTVTDGLTRSFFAAVTPISTAWTTANDAILIPFRVSSPVTFAETFFITGTTPGTANFDLGIYGEDFTRIASLGATACVNTTDAVMPAGGGAFSTPVTLTRGRYYMAMSAAATSITVRAETYSNSVCRAIGMQKMASAHPLPATITPASVANPQIIPMIALTTITNIL